MATVGLLAAADDTMEGDMYGVVPPELPGLLIDDSSGCGLGVTLPLSLGVALPLSLGVPLLPPVSEGSFGLDTIGRVGGGGGGWNDLVSDEVLVY